YAVLDTQIVAAICRIILAFVVEPAALVEFGIVRPVARIERLPGELIAPNQSRLGGTSERRVNGEVCRAQAGLSGRGEDKHRQRHCAFPSSAAVRRTSTDWAGFGDASDMPAALVGQTIAAGELNPAVQWQAIKRRPVERKLSTEVMGWSAL